MKKIFTLITLPMLFIANQAAAEAMLTLLKVESDIVYFSTDEAKSTTSPNCMAAENSDIWSLSLNTATGKAVYSLLVAATTGDRKITVTSANDCADAASFERAAGVQISQATASGSGGKAIYLYKADGITKVGRFVSLYNNHSDIFWYLPEGNHTSPQRYEPDSGTSTLYYKSTNCSGESYADSPSRVGRNKYRNGGRFYTSMDTIDGKGYQSKYEYRNAVLSCVNSSNSSMSTYKLDLSLGDPLCGENLCIIKEED